MHQLQSFPQPFGPVVLRRGEHQARLSLASLVLRVAVGRSVEEEASRSVSNYNCSPRVAAADWVQSLIKLLAK